MPLYSSGEEGENQPGEEAEEAVHQATEKKREGEQEVVPEGTSQFWALRKGSPVPITFRDQDTIPEGGINKDQREEKTEFTEEREERRRLH